jgi:hypothetical protein
MKQFDSCLGSGTLLIVGVTSPLHSLNWFRCKSPSSNRNLILRGKS